MNRYYVQAEMGISKTVRAKTAENARKNFLAKMEKDHPDIFEFIEDNVTVTCVYVDPEESDEREGWVDEFDRKIPTQDELLLAEQAQRNRQRGIASLPRNFNDD